MDNYVESIKCPRETLRVILMNSLGESEPVEATFNAVSYHVNVPRTTVYRVYQLSG